MPDKALLVQILTATSASLGAWPCAHHCGISDHGGRTYVLHIKLGGRVHCPSSTSSTGGTLIREMDQENEDPSTPPFETLPLE